MNKEQILELIRKQEQELYTDFVELREAYGADHRSTRHASAQWGAIVNLLELIEDENNL